MGFRESQKLYPMVLLVVDYHPNVIVIFKSALIFFKEVLR